MLLSPQKWDRERGLMTAEDLLVWMAELGSSEAQRQRKVEEDKQQGLPPLQMRD